MRTQLKQTVPGLVGRTVAAKVRGRPVVGRLSLRATNGAIHYCVGSISFDEDAVNLVKASAVLPVLVLR